MTSAQSLVPSPPFALVLDEDQELAEMLAEVLTQAGYRAMIAPDDIVPLDAVTRLQPDLIITPLHYREHLGGLLLLESLASDDATRNIPAIVASTDTDGLQRAAPQLQQLGATPLGRPFSIEDLRAVDAFVLERRCELAINRSVAEMGSISRSDSDERCNHLL